MLLLIQTCAALLCAFRGWNSHAGVDHRQQTINTHLVKRSHRNLTVLLQCCALNVTGEVNVFIAVFPLKPQICSTVFSGV